MKTPIKIWKSLKYHSLTKPVWVYRNLNSGLWSVRQDGRVIAHASNVFLKDVEYRVREGGRQRVIQEGRKNVHAFVIGTLCSADDIRKATGHLGDEELIHAHAYYNPYRHKTFVDFKTKEPILTSDFCDMDIYDKLCPVVAIWKEKRNA